MSHASSYAIMRIIEAQQNKNLDDGSGDVVFAMFLEPQESETNTIFKSVVNYVVNNLQPSPVFSHCELIVPCPPSSSLPVNFATYVGTKSGWQADKENNRRYYLGTTANKWRAVPVFGTHSARHVRKACKNSENVKYSFIRYITAAWGIRNIAPLVPDSARAPAHCATLTARVLNSGIPGILRHPSAWYGPSSLYAELCSNLKSRHIIPDSTNVDISLSCQVNCLLRHRDEDVSAMSNDEIMNAIRVLTLKASAAEAIDDYAMSSLTQKQLANALFRWAALRPTYNVE